MPGKRFLAPLCDEYRPFRSAPEVCATCGHLGDEHAAEAMPESDDFTQALTRVIIEQGAPYGYYAGGPETGYEARNQALRDHYASCGINWRKTGTPAMTDEAYFAGTFTDGHYTVELLTVEVLCRCAGEKMSDDLILSVDRFHAHYGVKWCMRDVTLSQLIWYVTHADDVEGGE